MTDDELKLMISEANGGDKSLCVTEEQFAQVLTRATNIWLSKLIIDDDCLFSVKRIN